MDKEAFTNYVDNFRKNLGNVGKISAWHKMRGGMHAREVGSKTVIIVHKQPAT